MQMEARPQNGWFWKKKDKRLEVFVPRLCLFSFFENKYGRSFHLFVFSTLVLRKCFRDFREVRSDICQQWRSAVVYTWPPVTKPREKRVGKKDESAHKHKKKCGFSAQLLSVDPNCSPDSCCWLLGMNSHGAAVVMSQMKSILTWDWTHQLEWSCLFSCRRQRIVAMDSPTSSLGSESRVLACG